MRYKVIVKNTERELEEAINGFYDRQCQSCGAINNSTPQFCFLGPPVQMQLGPKLFGIAQAFTY